MEKGVKPFEKKLKALHRHQLAGVMWGLVSFAKNRIDEDAVSNVCLDFASFMVQNANDKDIVVAFCRALVGDVNTKDHHAKTRSAVVANPKLAAMISQFNKKANNRTSFVDRLVERPDLQEALSKVSWGLA
jgi:ribose 5-phosphate isomerase RpiB